MPHPAENILDLKNVVKVYGKGFKKVKALNGVDLQLKRGRVLGLLGPNGAGKTTIIKMLLGLQKPTSGELLLFGSADISREKKERIGFLPEESYLYPFLTIKETVSFTAALYKNCKDTKSRINEMLDLVGVGQFSNRKISECSKGMARRTAMAQSLIHDPELILFDEPTSGYDPIGIAEVKELIKKLKARGKTILLCSHQLNEVEDLCDDILLLYKGDVIVSGEISELLGEQGEAFAISKNNTAKVSELLDTNSIEYEKFLRGDLEKFFIEKVKRCSAESL